MKILYTAKSPLAGVCELMCRVVNQYLRPEHEARVLNAGPGKHRWYCRPPADLVPRYSIKNAGHVDECLKWADVIHCMANVGVRSPYFRAYDPARLLRDKRWVFQWHGAQIWPFRQVWFPEDYGAVKFIHIGQGWVQTQAEWFAPFFEKWGAKVVPNLITVDDPLHVPMPWAERRDSTGFAPSQRNEGAVNRKGVEATKQHFQGFRHDLIMGVPFEECLNRKRRCKLGIDELVTPMYHRSGLEFLAQGTPCLCSWTQETWDTMREATGADRMPFINCKPQDLRRKLEWYWRELDEEAREQMGREAREWIDEFYHPRMLIERHLAVYEKE